MTTSDTPETDAAVISSNGQWSFVLKETCRRIERERDEAREHLAAAKHFLEKYIAERDNAREAFRELWASADAYLPSFSHETINRWRNLAGLDKK